MCYDKVATPAGFDGGGGGGVGGGSVRMNKPPFVECNQHQSLLFRLPEPIERLRTTFVCYSDGRRGQCFLKRTTHM